MAIRIAIDFHDMADAVEWLREATSAGTLSWQGDAFPMDALDTAKNGGVPKKNTYIFRRAGSRPNGLLETAQVPA